MQSLPRQLLQQCCSITTACRLGPHAHTPCFLISKNSSKSFHWSASSLRNRRSSPVHRMPHAARQRGAWMHSEPALLSHVTRCSCTSSWQHQGCSMDLPSGCCATYMCQTQPVTEDMEAGGVGVCSTEVATVLSPVAVAVKALAIRLGSVQAQPAVHPPPAAASKDCLGCGGCIPPATAGSQQPPAALACAC